MPRLNAVEYAYIVPAFDSSNQPDQPLRGWLYLHRYRLLDLSVKSTLRKCLVLEKGLRDCLWRYEYILANLVLAYSRDAISQQHRRYSQRRVRMGSGVWSQAWRSSVCTTSSEPHLWGDLDHPQLRSNIRYKLSNNVRSLVDRFFLLQGILLLLYI